MWAQASLFRQFSDTDAVCVSVCVCVCVVAML